MEITHRRSFTIPHKKVRLSGLSKKATSGLPNFTAIAISIPRALLFAGRHTGEIAVFRLDSDPLSSVASKGRTDLSGGYTAPTLDVPALTLAGHEGKVTAVSFHAGLSMLFSGSVDGQVRVWDPFAIDTKDRCLQVLSDHSRAVTCLGLHENLLITASIDGTVRVYSQMSQQSEALLTVMKTSMFPWYVECQVFSDFGGGWISCMACSPTRRVGDSPDVVVADSTGALTLFSSTSTPKPDGSMLFRLSFMRRIKEMHPLGVVAVTLLLKENMIATLCHDKAFRVFDHSSSKIFFYAQNPNDRTWTLMDYDNHSRECFLLDEAGCLSVWKYDVGNFVHHSFVFKPEGSAIPFVVQCCPQYESIFISTCFAVQEWAILRDPTYDKVTGHTGPVTFLSRVDLASHEQRLYSSGHDFRTCQWVVYGSGMNCLASRDESASEVMSMYCWVEDATAVDTLLAEKEGQDEPVKRMYIISGHEKGEVRLWNMQNDRTSVVQAHTNSVTSIARGKRLWSVRDRCLVDQPHFVCGSFDGCLSVFTFDTFSGGRLMMMDSVQVSEQEVLAVVVNDMNDSYITAGNDCLIRVWSSTDRFELLAELVGHRQPISCLAMDGNFLFSSGADLSIFVWDMFGNTSIRRLEGHREEVVSLAMMSSTGFLLSCSLDGTLTAWDYPAGRMAKRFKKPLRFHSCCIDPTPGSDVVFIGTETGAILQVRLQTVGIDAGDETQNSHPALVAQGAVIPTTETGENKRRKEFARRAADGAIVDGAVGDGHDADLSEDDEVDEAVLDVLHAKAAGSPEISGDRSRSRSRRAELELELEMEAEMETADGGGDGGSSKKERPKPGQVVVFESRQKEPKAPELSPDMASVRKLLSGPGSLRRSLLMRTQFSGV